MEVQLETTTEGVSAAKIIRSIENPGLDNGKNFPYDKDNYLRSLCSGKISSDFPFRKYSVKRFTDLGYVTVFWTYKTDLS